MCTKGTKRAIQVAQLNDRSIRIMQAISNKHSTGTDSLSRMNKL